MSKVLCIDPGTTHLVAAIFDTFEPDNTKLVWHYMFNVGHEPVKIANACKLMSQICKHYGVVDCLLEYQAPMGNMCASCRI